MGDLLHRGRLVEVACRARSRGRACRSVASGMRRPGGFRRAFVAHHRVRHVLAARAVAGLAATPSSSHLGRDRRCGTSGRPGSAADPRPAPCISLRLRCAEHRPGVGVRAPPPDAVLVARRSPRWHLPARLRTHVLRTGALSASSIPGAVRPPGVPPFEQRVCDLEASPSRDRPARCAARRGATPSRCGS